MPTAHWNGRSAEPSGEGYVFNHIPKTGGTTVYRVLEHVIGPVVSPPLALSDDIHYDVTARDYEQYLVIYGHIGIVWNDVLGPNRRWMTMLRDPVDRVLSQYYFWRGLPANPDLPHVHAAQTLPIEEFVRSRDFMVLQGNNNVQTWFLADDFRRKFRKIPESDALDIAKQHLTERCVFIGIFEDFNNSVMRLCQVLNVPYPEPPVPAENVTPLRKQRSEIDPEVIAAIQGLNTLDQALYEYAGTITHQVAEKARQRLGTELLRHVTP